MHSTAGYHLLPDALLTPLLAGVLTSAKRLCTRDKRDREDEIRVSQLLVEPEAWETENSINANFLRMLVAAWLFTKSVCRPQQAA